MSPKPSIPNALDGSAASGGRGMSILIGMSRLFATVTIMGLVVLARACSVSRDAYVKNTMYMS